jgi:hypothetical protein
MASDRLWPTQRASMNENRTTKPAPSHGVTHGSTLAGVASRPDPTTTTDGKNGSPQADLNPRFVEALMGLPDGWSDPLASLTDSTCSATDSSRNAPQKQSDNSPHEQGASSD